MRVVALCSYPPGAVVQALHDIHGLDLIAIVVDEDVESSVRCVLPRDLALVIGKEASRVYHPGWFGTARVLEIPEITSEYRDADFDFLLRLIHEGKHDLSLQFRRGRLIATELIPF